MSSSAWALIEAQAVHTRYDKGRVACALHHTVPRAGCSTCASAYLHSIESRLAPANAQSSNSWSAPGGFKPDSLRVGAASRGRARHALLVRLQVCLRHANLCADTAAVALRRIVCERRVLAVCMAHENIRLAPVSGQAGRAVGVTIFAGLRTTQTLYSHCCGRSTIALSNTR